jgi:dTDP-4-amino-4,6-dideoxygalactose transaminase
MSSLPPMFRPNFDASDLSAIGDTLDSGMVATGRRTRDFESSIASAVEAEDAVATNSGTSAMTLALSILGIGDGDEVITPSLTCIGVVNAIVRSGATPVFADIDDETLTLDPDSVRSATSDRTRGVVPVHYGGHAYDIAGMTAVASEGGFPVISDLAHALGATVDGHSVGRGADLALLSFHATKIITTGEGGMLAGPASLIERGRLDTAHGLADIGADPADFVGERWVYPGVKVGMSDIQAALGSSQYARLDELLLARRRVAERYTEALAEHPGLRVPIERRGVRSSWHFYTLRIRPEIVGTAGEFIAKVQEFGGTASRQFYPAHLMPLFSTTSSRRVPLPVTERESFVSLSLPVFPGITDAQVDAVIAAVLRAAA